jgi:hypothetical protein
MERSDKKKPRKCENNMAVYDSAKYTIIVTFKIHGVVEKPDVVGALFGQ